MTGFRLDGRRALVTGAAGGIGSALAVAFAEAGADLILTDRPGTEVRPDVLEAVAAAGHTVHWHEQDLERTEELASMAHALWDGYGPIDVLVNNAGVVSLARAEDTDLSTWRRTMSVDLEASFVLSTELARRMASERIRGRIIMMASKNGLVAEPGLAAYNAAKGGMILLTQSLAAEFGGFGITVNALCPGVVDTGFAGGFDLDWDAFVAYYREHIPLEGRFADPAEIAAPAVFLASDAASYVTGSSLVVDGGVLAQQLPRLQFMPPSRWRTDVEE